MRKAVAAAALSLTAAAVLRADLTFTNTRKRTGGASVAGRDNTSKFFLKGDKLKMERADRIVVLDFRTNTFQSLDVRAKTFSVIPIGPPKSEKARVEVRDSHPSKTRDGYEARELTLATTLDSPELERAGMRIRMEMSCQVAQDGTGMKELLDFYKRNGARIPWRALGGDGNSSIEEAIAEMERALTTLPAVPLLQVLALKPSDGAASQGKLQATPAQATKIREAMAELDATIQKGGPDADKAARSLAIMSAVVAPERHLDESGALFEITLESSGFSTQPIPDSVFAVPAGYTSK